MQSAFTEIGVIAVREDVNLEPAFWAQFPGNFKDIARRALISTANFAGFASGHNFPVGQARGQPLGPGRHRARDHLGRALLLQLPQGRPRQLHRHRPVGLGQDGGAELPAGPGPASSTRASSSSTRTAAPRSSCAPSAAATTRIRPGRAHRLQSRCSCPTRRPTARFLTDWSARLVTADGETLSAEDIARDHGGRRRQLRPGAGLSAACAISASCSAASAAPHAADLAARLRALVGRGRARLAVRQRRRPARPRAPASSAST